MTTLEKIRTEIENIKDFEAVNGGLYVRQYDVVQIIDKYEEPCEDAVSRQAVLDATVNKNSIWNSITNSKGENLEEIILQLSSVRPQEQTGHWMPISEKLPEDGTWNLFTDGRKVSVERYKTDALDHFYPNGRWFSLEEAIAWMPLPEPYKVQKNGDAE